MQGLKIIACYLFAIAAVIGLQMFPLTGVFLMMLLGVVWAAVLLNLMLLHLSLRAITGAIERAWIFVPLVFYVGWGTFALTSNLSARQFKAANEAVAAETRHVSAGVAEVLVRSPDQNLADSLAAELVHITDGIRIFTVGREFLRVARNDERCSFKPGAATRAHNYFPEYGAGGYGIATYNTCVISVAHVTPAADVLIEVERLNAAPERDTSHRFDLGRSQRISVVGFGPSMNHNIDAIQLGERYDFKVRADTGGWTELGQSVRGKISVASPIPIFMAGCALNSAAPRWECVFGPWRQRLEIGAVETPNALRGRTDSAAYVARAIGLPTRF